MTTSIAENYQRITQQIQNAEKAAGRTPSSVHLLAVSKTRKSDELETLYQLGQRAFGENYLQEALDKQDALGHLAIEWHFIGPIQSNKTRPIAEQFDWVHSVDRFKIAQRLNDQRPDEHEALNICVQVNISREETKSGCLPEEAEELLNQISALPKITLRGLMAIPKATQDTSEQHQALHEMAQLFTRCKALHPSMDTLSMGMSDDMEIAIQEGATMVRIGTALFGPRPPKPDAP
jgi:pyridoxal phosphate enzyme (YggS family)